MINETLVELLRKNFGVNYLSPNIRADHYISPFYLSANFSTSLVAPYRKNILLDTQRPSHPLYHSIISSNSDFYQFNNSNVDFDWICFDTGDSKKSLHDYGRPFCFYTEETECLTSKDQSRLNTLKRIYECHRFYGCLSHIKETKTYLDNLLGTDKNKHIPLPAIQTDFTIDFFDRSLNEENVIVFFCSSFSNRTKEQSRLRGQHVLDKAFCLAKESSKNLRLISVKTDLGWEAKEKYPNDVYLIDAKNIDDISLNHYYAASDIFVLPSLRVHAHSLLSAINYGLACIGTKTFGFRDFIEPGVNGFLFSAPLEGCIIDHNYGPITIPENYERYSRGDNIDGLVENISDSLVYLEKNRHCLRRMRLQSHRKSIKDFNKRNHQKIIERILCNQE